MSGQSKAADCETSWILCDKSPVFINDLPGFGSLSESSPGPCFPNGFAETNSVWLKWKVAEAGTLDYTILPLNETDDIDFVLYRLNGFDDCASQEIVRCMAAGPNLGAESPVSAACTGATGLRTDAVGTSQSRGCPEDSKNFLRSVEMQAGEYYVLFINNFRSAGGILVEWGGTATFQQIAGRCTPSSPPTSPTLDNGAQIQFSEVFPNPTSNNVRISAISDQEHPGQLQIIGSDGQLELSMSFMLSTGNNTLELPTANLRRGIHFVKLRTGGETHILRFVKE